MVFKRAIYIVAARRTPFGTYGGKLKDYSATHLQELANRAALKQANLSPEAIDNVVVGNVMQSSSDAAYISRHAALRAGVPIHVPALTVNRLCGSGFQSIISGGQEIELGNSTVVLCGGAESMSQAPYAVRNIRFGTKLGQDLKLEDTLWQGLTDEYAKTPMGITGNLLRYKKKYINLILCCFILILAENLAKKYNVTRQDTDQYALQSQQRWKKANDQGFFKDEIEPIKTKGKKGAEEIFDTDEHPRPQTTLEQLSKLPAVFIKDKGTVTAGNASGICDGAAAVIICTEEALKKYNLKPLARLIAYHVSAVEPTLMGFGPVPAIENLLKKTEKQISDIDLFDINEAFAPQILACQKVLKLPNEKSNVNGGAIALGHPLGASGTRITANLVYELKRRQGKYAIGAACIGGGQGISLLIERV
jgi:acetyl-CoA acyltransferase 2